MRLRSLTTIGCEMKSLSTNKKKKNDIRSAWNTFPGVKKTKKLYRPEGQFTGAGHFVTSVTRHFGTTKLVPKFKKNHRWSCVSSELSWVEVSRLFLDHGTRVEVS